jgi:hypothetical protein
MGLLIGTARCRLRQGLKRIEEGCYDGELGRYSGVVNAGKKMTDNAGPRVSEGEGGRVPFRAEAVLGRGRFGGWAEMAPPSPFLFFLFFLLL